MCFREPEIPEVPDVDKPVVRNVLYTAWALQENTGAPSIGWQVRTTTHPGATAPQPQPKRAPMFRCTGCEPHLPTHREKVQVKRDGYLVLVSFGKNFSIGLQDLQLISDVNPLRIDTISVRSPGSDDGKTVGCVLAIRVLDQNQPVRITEAEVIRVRKRHRGFGAGMASMISSFVTGGQLA